MSDQDNSLNFEITFKNRTWDILLSIVKNTGLTEWIWSPTQPQGSITHRKVITVFSCGVLEKNNKAGHRVHTTFSMPWCKNDTFRWKWSAYCQGLAWIYSIPDWKYFGYRDKMGIHWWHLHDEKVTYSSIRHPVHDARVVISATAQNRQLVHIYAGYYLIY